MGVQSGILCKLSKEATSPVSDVSDILADVSSSMFAKLHKPIGRC